MDELWQFFRFVTLVQGIIGLLLLAGLIVWRDDFKRWRK